MKKKTIKKAGQGKKTAKIKKTKKVKAVKKPKAAPKAPKARKLLKTDIRHYLSILNEKKKNVLEELNKHLDDGRKIEFNEVKDSVDLATDTYDTEFLHNLSDTEKKLLEDIDLAIEKAEKGEYGACETCGKPISKERLEALPFSKNCISCQTKKEI